MEKFGLKQGNVFLQVLGLAVAETTTLYFILLPSFEIGFIPAVTDLVLVPQLANGKVTTGNVINSIAYESRLCRIRRANKKITKDIIRIKRDKSADKFRAPFKIDSKKHCA